MFATTTVKLRRLALAAIALGLMSVSAACAVPVEIDGETLGAAFSIHDDSPEVKGNEARTQLVFSEDDGETLRTLALQFENPSLLEIGVAIPLSEKSRPTIKATVGDLVTFVRNDGVVVKSAENFRASVSVSGEVILEQVSPCFAGAFRAEMDDGGQLEGSFVVAP